MILSPRYDGPPHLSFDNTSDDHLTPTVRQHRRLAELLRSIDQQAWATPSRCDGWTTRDVVAHLVGVNNFWIGSISAGLAGNPTRILAGFDPATTPPLLVHGMAELSNEEILNQFLTGSEALLEILTSLADSDWSVLAESPPGHVPIRLVVHHALWDSWVHERDIAIPLGLVVPEHADEITMCLRYVAALSPTLGLEYAKPITGRFAVHATDPNIEFMIEINEHVVVYSNVAEDVPVLRGKAVSLTEALSLRAPMPPDTPAEWHELLGGLKTAFDAH